VRGGRWMSTVVCRARERGAGVGAGARGKGQSQGWGKGAGGRIPDTRQQRRVAHVEVFDQLVAPRPLAAPPAQGDRWQVEGAGTTHVLGEVM